MPTEFAIPLGFIVNELVTNSPKYAESHITVELRRRRPPIFRYPCRTAQDCPTELIPLIAKDLE